MNKPRFLSASSKSGSPHIVIMGVPFDGTSSGRKGADQAPDRIRIASDLLETYSPHLDADLEDFSITDLGDMEIPAESPFEAIDKAARELFRSGSKPVFIGGEHSISPALVKAAVESHPGLHLIVFDAHTDLRKEYQGSRFSHACASRRMAEIVGWDNIRLVGVRSGTRREFEEARSRSILLDAGYQELMPLAMEIGERPVYISFDIDVFDPSLVPGTGTPEPGGIEYVDFIDCVQELLGINLVGFDIVELCPPMDPAGTSAVFAASVIRELMLLMAREQLIKPHLIWKNTDY